ncbi:MAG: ATP-binding protein [Thermodesulforhabdaceae bacterium]
MIKKKPRFALNIRQKVVLSFIFYALVVLTIGYYSYTNLERIEHKIVFLEKLNELSSAALEMRRYEKNYLLYQSAEALDEMAAYMKRIEEIIGEITPFVGTLDVSKMVEELRSGFSNYKAIAERINGKKALTEDEVDQLRNQGKRLISSIEAAVTQERSKIFAIIRFLKTQLLAVLGIAVVIGVFIANMIAVKVIRPLKEIEKATLAIAEGNLDQLPVPETRDETRNVIEAFNRMLRELDMRQDELIQAKKLSSLGILTSGVAHQLNNPLNNISTTAQIILMDMNQMPQETLKSMIMNIEKETRRAQDIVKGLLEFSRAKQFSIVPTHLKSLINKTIQLMASQLPTQINIVVDVPNDLTIPMDPQRMQQVFLNMITNAVQAMETSKGKIEIIAKVDPESDKAVIKIRDTGKGIPKEHIGRIFDPFFTTKEGSSGTGLGLSIAYGIVKKHRGSIEVTSEVGKGTEFTIRLPLTNKETS